MTLPYFNIEFFIIPSVRLSTHSSSVTMKITFRNTAKRFFNFAEHHLIKIYKELFIVFMQIHEYTDYTV